MITLEFSYPPSTNTYYRTLRSGRLAGRVLISQRGRDYRKHVEEIAGRLTPMEGKLEVLVSLFPPDRRRRDIDNCQKALFDALTHVGAWHDDSQVKRLVVDMHDDIQGKVVITIRPMT